MSTDIILDRQEGSITFIVDRDLPEPEDHIESVLTPREIAEASLWEWGNSGKNQNTVTYILKSKRFRRY